MSSISISTRISNTIGTYSPGSIFTYSDFNFPKEKALALAKSLSRLAEKGDIVRIGKGKYYKPRKTTFGNIKPDENQIIKLFTEKNDTKVGYLSGVNAFNRLGLTTQLSNVIVIATSNPQPEKEMSGYRIKFIKRDFEIEENDVPLLQLLDAIRYIKKIPDASPNNVLKVIISKLKNLPASKLKRFAKLALNYNAATKAMVGALLESYAKEISVASLYKSLNTFSIYEMKISPSLLPNQSKWNIE